MRRITFEPKAWDSYVSWQNTDKTLVKKMNNLIKEIQRTPFSGTGKPEPLKNEFSGFWSRRINDYHRLIYAATDNNVLIFQCSYHYKE